MRGQGRHHRVPGLWRRDGHRQRAGAARHAGGQAPPKGLLLGEAVACEGAQAHHLALSPWPSSRTARGAYRRGHGHVQGPVQHAAGQEVVADSGPGRVRRTGGFNASAHRRVRVRRFFSAAPVFSWLSPHRRCLSLCTSRGTGAGTVEVPALDAETDLESVWAMEGIATPGSHPGRAQLPVRSVPGRRSGERAHPRDHIRRQRGRQGAVVRSSPEQSHGDCMRPAFKISVAVHRSFPILVVWFIRASSIGHLMVHLMVHHMIIL